jgi:pimeloyl-ACP methyl ester carboxylesterase
MVEPLRRLGLRTAAVELPSCGPLTGPPPAGDLSADVEAVRAAAANGPVVLVGSSYGGMVITAAAGSLPHLAHLVYVSAMLPAAGESVADLAAADDDGAPGWLAPREDGTLGLRPEVSAERFTEHFLTGCDQQAVDGALARIGRQSAAAFTRPPGHAGWIHTPSTAVVCTADRATPPARQRRWAARAGTVVELDAGHHPFLSHPDTLADLIAATAR